MADQQQQGLTRQPAPASTTELSPIEKAYELAAQPIRTPLELALRVTIMKQFAHVMSPAIALSEIADGHTVNTAVVVIDTALSKVDYGSAAGDDIYFQSSIHKHQSRKVGDDWTTDVQEVSLNVKALDRILAAAGVDIPKGGSRRTDDGSNPYRWAWTVEGELEEFDGRRRKLPPGSVEIDYSDGSAQIGGWTPALWAERVADAEKRKQACKSESDRKKIKPEPINGWSEERVRNARRFGARIAESEARNRLARNIGVKQKYTLDELKKPFVFFRYTFVPDMKDPAVKLLVTARKIGASEMLLGHAMGAALPASEPKVIDVSATTSSAAPSTSPVIESAVLPDGSATAPDGAEAFDDLPELTVEASAPAVTTYHLKAASKLPIDGVEHFFFESAEGPLFVVTDVTAARQLLAFKKSNAALEIESEPLTLQGRTYRHAIEWKVAGAPEGKY